MIKKTLGLFFIFLFSLAPAAEVHASDASPAAWVKQSDLARLVDQAAIPPGAIVQTSITKADEEMLRERCPTALFSNRQNNPVWGRTLLQVQCVGSDTTPFFVHVQFDIWAPVLVVKSQIQRGDQIEPDQIEYRTMNIAELTRGWITELSDLDNKTANRPLWPGTTLTHSALKGRTLVKHGDTVKIRVKGPGFRIAGNGTALEAAEKGDIVKIRTEQGKVLHGIAVAHMEVEVTL